jgi:membrane-bound serine protease (ClpP class)
LGIVFFVLEAKFPTHGILGFGGALAMLAGALMLVKSPITAGGVSVSTALGATIPFALIIIFLMRLVLRSRHWKDSTGMEQLVGEVGEVKEPVQMPSGTGMVFVHGELWRAAASQQIPVGTRVRVKHVDGLTLQVEPVEKQTVSS